jgi:uncharacterized protein YjbI with pentapeptide repeats
LSLHDSNLLNSTSHNRIRLGQANYDGARFSGNFDGATIEIAKGSSARNVRIENLKFARFSAPGVDLSGLQADCSNIITFDVPGAKLYGASMRGATLGMSSNFSAAQISGEGEDAADFSQMNARGVNFRLATIQSAAFDSADLEGAKFDGAVIEKVNFKYNNLQNVSFREVTFRKVNFEVPEEELRAAEERVRMKKMGGNA